MWALHPEHKIAIIQKISFKNGNTTLIYRIAINNVTIEMKIEN